MKSMSDSFNQSLCLITALEKEIANVKGWLEKGECREYYEMKLKALQGAYDSLTKEGRFVTDDFFLVEKEGGYFDKRGRREKE